jgi:hypothetical protein
MRHLKIIYLTVLAAFLISAIGASGASAAFNKEWEVSECVKEATKTFLYTDSKCTVDSATKQGEWEILWKKVGSTPVLVDTKTSKLELSSGGTTVECPGTGMGTVGEKGKDLTESITVGTCKIVTAGFCETLISVKPVNLPWSTQLVEVGGELRDLLSSDGNGNPGWAVTCKTFLGNKTATCTAADGTTKVTNNVPEDVVEAEFEAKTEKAKCTGGTSSEGSVLGTVTNLALVAGEMRWLRAS